MHYSANFIRQLPKTERTTFLSGLTDQEAALLLYDWSFWARGSQKPPVGDWLHWLILAGRGFGKTRAGAEWVRTIAESGQAERIALVGPTLNDARSVMVEGESGILAVCPPWNKPKFESSKRTLTWPNGTVATLFSAEEPDRLRGPQHGAAWCDELCAWRHSQETWDNLMFGLRLGAKPQTVVTTTPKPIPLLKQLLVDTEGHVAITRGSTFDNLENLPASFADELTCKYQGTRLGRQELMAEVLEDVPGALWNHAQLDRLRVRQAPDMVRIVVAIDPPASAGEKADECGIVAAGVSEDNTACVLADASEQGLSPAGWAAKAVTLFHTLRADRIVVEGNQGGAMVESVIRQVDANVPVTTVYATRNKRTRAEPVAALYEQSRVFHAGLFSALEDQMCSFTGERTGPYGSPDRVDALVWALTHLLLGRDVTPKIRTL